jgi:hypothetical protein
MAKRKLKNLEAWLLAGPARPELDAFADWANGPSPATVQVIANMTVAKDILATIDQQLATHSKSIRLVLSPGFEHLLRAAKSELAHLIITPEVAREICTEG